MNINQENTIIEVYEKIAKFNCEDINCEHCPFYIDGEYVCLCLKLAKVHTDIMIRRGTWKRDSDGHLIVD